jgi:hypothetical protein
MENISVRVSSIMAWHRCKRRHRSHKVPSINSLCTSKVDSRVGSRGSSGRARGG